MNISPRDQAVAAQNEASDPAVSAFVSASAGSGKTKLLTDRLLRLLMAGTSPGAICCLTYTKAAAAEMAVRLAKTLGEWVTKPDPELDTALRDLEIEPTEASRQTARGLFGLVLDFPGGMRIGTIHSFCQSLLRRFPLEAKLSPHFELADERDAEEMLNEALEATIGNPDGPEQAALARLAPLIDLRQLRDLIRKLAANESGWAALQPLAPSTYHARLAETLRLRHQSLADLMADACAPRNETVLRDHLRIMAAQKNETPRKQATKGLGWLELSPAGRAEYWSDWCITFLTAANQARKLQTMLGKALFDANPELVADIEREQERILDFDQQRAALAVLEASTALITLAKTILASFDVRKSRAGLLDYGDLILRTKTLLENPGVAWVRYKLDEGIDHLLLDEVQDTSPSQWDIARQLWDEFFAGTGARDTNRTVFAVGDPKQSIYSFQGADPEGFQRERTRLAKRALDAGMGFAQPSLNVSFRSAAPILTLVDEIFHIPPAAQGVADGGWFDHRIWREGHAGRVDIWPLAPRPEAAPQEAWQTAGSYQTTVSARQRLADALAEWIAGQTSGTVMLESKNRPLRPGDVLVLVRKRNDFVRALGRALKQRHVPVAGLDRMMLTDEPAVQDLLALCRVLLLPEDNLSLAEFLVSPLGGISDESLMELSLGRSPASLFQQLTARASEREDWRQAHEMLRKLLARVDFIAPHALLAVALGELGGRARLLARLGPDAAEPIDELLAASLRHSALYPPSLQAFLHWLEESGAEIKREADASGGVVRIMTVHGAKGLQAPLVILPDTTGEPGKRENLIFPSDALPYWLPGADALCDRAREDQDALRKSAQAEENRLLYVALTRAEDRLLVCGAEPGRNAGTAPSWYDMIAQGAERLTPHAGFSTRDFNDVAQPWLGAAMAIEVPQTAKREEDKARATHKLAPPPAWLGAEPEWRSAPPPTEPALPQPLAPSRPLDAQMGPVPAAISPAQSADRFARGKLIHLLLQHLPDLAPGLRREAALKAARGTPGVSDATHIVEQILALLESPALAPLFGPASRAEVPLSGLIGTHVVQGVVDRLAVLDDRVIIADYKSNRARPAKVPVMYLRQMAAYRAVISRIFPNHEVQCLLIWTQDGTITHLTQADLAAQAIQNYLK